MSLKAYKTNGTGWAGRICTKKESTSGGRHLTRRSQTTPTGLREGNPTTTTTTKTASTSGPRVPGTTGIATTTFTTYASTTLHSTVKTVDNKYWFTQDVPTLNANYLRKHLDLKNRKHI